VRSLTAQAVRVAPYNFPTYLLTQGNDVAKRCVFRRRLKLLSVSDAVMLDGKVFQARGAATKNAWSPIVVRHEDGVTRADVDEDRSLFLVSTSATRRSSLAMYRTMHTSEDENREFKLYPLWHLQPVKVAE